MDAYAFVDGCQGLRAAVLFELEFDAEGEDFEAQVWVAGEGEEGLEGIAVVGCGRDVVSMNPVQMSVILQQMNGQCEGERPR